jgi:hypothetical protein
MVVFVRKQQENVNKEWHKYTDSEGTEKGRSLSLSLSLSLCFGKREGRAGVVLSRKTVNCQSRLFKPL